MTKSLKISFSKSIYAIIMECRTVTLQLRFFKVMRTSGKTKNIRTKPASIPKIYGLDGGLEPPILGCRSIAQPINFFGYKNNITNKIQLR